MHSLRLLTPAMLAVLYATTAAADTDRNLAATCTACHGPEGRALAESGIDSLAGVPTATTRQKLREFRAGTRPATLMHQIAKGYTEEELDRIAAWFARPSALLRNP